MRIEAVMTSPTVVVPSETPVKEVVTRLIRRGFGARPVTEAGRPDSRRDNVEPRRHARRELTTRVEI
ncbi:MULTISPECIES: CBS domain-containing protein [unclassified Pseudofrankia]|uniref:CBS domain-containing protein n=1 Tax=unclassified Pseudofrankia TaxID=2994372 RepID=UPI0008DB1BC3|nr:MULTISPECIES: CBS domain-containing protein [unclassified Pseudofrankia]MDT3446692.1 CBS domain-containing protein [Pseudofrankia sp. BMG5.37]OHV57557.1 hypothetical protein BCD48_42970 [Pseudofrankia sp. BMG5.36]